MDRNQSRDDSYKTQDRICVIPKEEVETEIFSEFSNTIQKQLNENKVLIKEEVKDQAKNDEFEEEKIRSNDQLKVNENHYFRN